MSTHGTVSIDDGVLKDRHLAADAAIARSKLAQRVLGIDCVPLSQCRVWDARQTNLPVTPATDDLGLVTGTWGIDQLSIQTGDCKTITATRYAGLQIQIPNDYEDGETITLRLIAGMKTTVADGSATIDVEARLNPEDGTVGSDICATAAQSINNTTPAAKDFQITATSIVAGMILDVRIAIAVTDTATVTAVIGRLLAIKLMTDRR